MKASFLTTILILMFTLISCNKDKEVNSVLFSTWEAKSFMSIESVAYPKNENNKIMLTFLPSGTYQIKLDINSCGGIITWENNNQLEIDSPACTEACCASKFSEKLVTMLPKVTSYSIEGRTLKLNVPQWGYIEFVLLEGLD